MKKSKRFLALLVALIMLIAIALPAAPVFAEDTNLDAEGYIIFKDDNFRTAINSDMEWAPDRKLKPDDLATISTLYVSNSRISDMSEISYFTALGMLRCNNNQLSELDVSYNPALSSLSCYNNQLSELDVSNNPALVYLYCENNQLSELDVSNNHNLFWLDCENNQLSELDVSNNPALSYLYCENNQLSELDVSNNPGLDNLYCNNNQLSELDVSNNPKLTILYCGNNQLSELGVSNNPKLTILYCVNNQLGELDVSNDPALWHLYCYDNQLTELDVSNNPELEYLYCNHNYIPYRSAIVGGVNTNVTVNPQNSFIAATVSNDDSRGSVSVPTVITAEGDQAMTPTPAGIGQFVPGQKVQFTAAANTGFKFDKWEAISGLDTTGLDLTQESLSITMPATDVAIKATFALKTYMVTLTQVAGLEYTGFIPGDANAVKHGETFSFVPVIKEGYKETSSLNVYCNGEELFSDENGRYTTPALAGAAVITVKGVNPDPVYDPSKYHIVSLDNGAGYSFDAKMPANGKVVDGGTYTFKLKISQNFDESVPVVKANGIVITPVNGVYSVKRITQDIEITVEGIVKDNK